MQNVRNRCYVAMSIIHFHIAISHLHYNAHFYRDYSETLKKL